MELNIGEGRERGGEGRGEGRDGGGGGKNVCILPLTLKTFIIQCIKIFNRFKGITPSFPSFPLPYRTSFLPFLFYFADAQNNASSPSTG